MKCCAVMIFLLLSNKQLLMQYNKCGGMCCVNQLESQQWSAEFAQHVMGFDWRQDVARCARQPLARGDCRVRARRLQASNLSVPKRPRAG